MAHCRYVALQLLLALPVSASPSLSDVRCKLTLGLILPVRVRSLKYATKPDADRLLMNPPEEPAEESYSSYTSDGEISGYEGDDYIDT